MNRLEEVLSPGQEARPVYCRSPKIIRVCRGSWRMNLIKWNMKWTLGYIEFIGT